MWWTKFARFTSTRSTIKWQVELVYYFLEEDGGGGCCGMTPPKRRRKKERSFDKRLAFCWRCWPVSIVKKRCWDCRVFSSGVQIDVLRQKLTTQNKSLQANALSFCVFVSGFLFCFICCVVDSTCSKLGRRALEAAGGRAGGRFFFCGPCLLAGLLLCPRCILKNI